MRYKPVSNMTKITQDFAEHTTFHGLRFIIRPESSVAKRSVWAFLVALCVSLLIYQIVDRVVYYYQYPVSVNVRINYNMTMEFPAVTLCNQNAFMASKSEDLGRYDLIESMYSGSGNISDSNLADYGNLTLEQLFLESAQSKEKLIHRCSWRGRECTHEDFNTSITDHGVCHTFYKEGDEQVASTGVENGLSVTLNVEQYEYMTGPHNAAGVKMLLHGLIDTPRVHSLGQALSTGANIFVGVKTTLVNNLPAPYGICEDRKLEFFEKYTTSNCQTECLTKRAARHCGCRLPFMPVKDGFPKACALRDYIYCMKDFVEFYTKSDDKECHCPVSCHMDMFDTEISYASISDFALEKVVTPEESKLLIGDLLQGRETMSRKDDLHAGQMRLLVEDFNTTFRAVTELLSVTVNHKVAMLLNASSDMYLSQQKLYQYKEQLYRFQIHNIEKNFIRARDSCEEDFIHMVSLAYWEFIFDTENTIRRLADPQTDVTSRTVLLDSLYDKVSTKKAIIASSKENITTLARAYEIGEPLFRYRFPGFLISANKISAPKELLRAEFTKRPGLVRNLEYNLVQLIQHLDAYIEMANFTYHNRSVDESEIIDIRRKYRRTMKMFLYRRSVFYTEIIEGPKRVLESQLLEFNEMWSKFNLIVETMQQILKSLDDDLQHINRNITKPFHKVLEDVMNYYAGGSQTKIQIANQMTSQLIQDGISHYRTFFQQIHVRETDLLQLLNRQEQVVLKLMKTIVEDKDSWRFYNYTNRFDLVGNYAEKEADVKTDFTKVRDMVDCSKAIGNKDVLFLDAIERFIDHSQEYNRSIKIDSDFIHNNFLQVDVFYRRMSYEAVDQQEDYNGFALLCDIGGSLGLFVGASVLTLFEILDLVLWNPFWKRKAKMKEYDLKLSEKRDRCLEGSSEL